MSYKENWIRYFNKSIGVSRRLGRNIWYINNPDIKQTTPEKNKNPKSQCIINVDKTTNRKQLKSNKKIKED